MKRQRGRGRKPGNPGNRSYESNGPEVKIRGNASQIYEKYLQLARDATSAGDRVRAENLYQHAEHYFRIVQANQPPKRDDRDGDNADGDGQNNQGQNNQGHQNQGRDRNRNNSQNNDGQSGDNSGGDAKDPMAVVTPEGGDVGGDQAKSGDGEDQSSNRRRTRRPRRSSSRSADGGDNADAEAALANAPSDDKSEDGKKSDSESEAA